MSVKLFMRRPLHQASRLMFVTLSLGCSLVALGAGEASQPSDTPPPVVSKQQPQQKQPEPDGEVKLTDPTPPLRLQPALISIAAKQGGMMSFNEQEPSKLLGGVRLGYEEILVLCDHVHYWQSKMLGVKRAVLDHALITSGPDAEEPDHVVFDSRATKLPQISFRGLMRPGSVEIIRQPLTAQDQARLEERRLREKAKAETKPAAKPDTKPETKPASKPDAKPDAAPAEPSVLVRFRVLLHQFGEFAGDLKTTDGWAPHFGWAEEAEVTVVCDVLPDGIANPRFSAIDLKGRPAGEGVDKRPARLGRKHIPLVGAAVQKEFDAEAYDWWAESSHISIEFDDQGRVLRIKTGADYRGEGTPSLDTPVQTLDPTQVPKAQTPGKTPTLEKAQTPEAVPPAQP